MPNRQQFRISGNDPGTRVPAAGIVSKLLTALASAVVLVVAFMVSLVVFAAVAAAALTAVAYLWWKTRALRKEMRERPRGGRIIEGEATRDTSR